MRKSMEKRAVLGVLATLTGKAAMTAAKHPIATLTAASVGMGATGEYKKNMTKFQPTMQGQQVPNPPGVG